MCGIAGYFSQGANPHAYSEPLEKATRSLQRRGPDYQAIWKDDFVGLGHRRLSILDTSALGHQPMHSPDGRWHIVFNGEIFNFRALRAELENKGYTFSSQSDTEVLLAAWQEWGEASISRLNGFFAFALYDQWEKAIYLVRDRFGIKPLVYVETDHAIFFASETKALFSFPWEKSIARESLNLYFQLTYIPTSHSIFTHVKKVKPGHFIKISEKGASEIEYYTVSYTPTRTSANEHESKKQLHTLVSSAVTDRLISDVPIGTFLSGGIDSSIVSAIAARELGELHTFSIGYRDHPYYDETKYAELVAKRYGTNHHTFSLSNTDLLEHVEEVLDYLDEPFADSSALPVFILSKLTRQHVTVALSGDGADELFSGYTKHKAWVLADRIGYARSAFLLLNPLVKNWSLSRSNPMSNALRQFQKFAEITPLNYKQRYWQLASFQKENVVQSLLRPEFFQSLQPFVNENIFVNNSDLNEMLKQDIKLVLAGDMLPKVDSMSMANGLEVRVPFLDYRIVDFAFSLDSKLKLSGKTTKYLLKEAFKEYLPEELFQRGKHGFEVPLVSWFQKELKQKLDLVIFNEELIESQKIFNWPFLKMIRKKLHSTNPGDVTILVWQLLVFNSWWLKNYKPNHV